MYNYRYTRRFKVFRC